MGGECSAKHTSCPSRCNSRCGVPANPPFTWLHFHAIQDPLIRPGSMVYRWNDATIKKILPNRQQPLGQLLSKLLFLLAWSRLKPPLSGNSRISFPDVKLVQVLVSNQICHLHRLVRKSPAHFPK